MLFAFPVMSEFRRLIMNSQKFSNMSPGWADLRLSIGKEMPALAAEIRGENLPQFAGNRRLNPSGGRG